MNTGWLDWRDHSVGPARSGTADLAGTTTG
jgi:hypothetical protein